MDEFAAIQLLDIVGVARVLCGEQLGSDPADAIVAMHLIRIVRFPMQTFICNRMQFVSSQP